MTTLRQPLDVDKGQPFTLVGKDVEGKEAAVRFDFLPEYVNCVMYNLSTLEGEVTHLSRHYAGLVELSLRRYGWVRKE